MTSFFLALAVAEVAVIALLLVRAAIGPTVTDRVIALNMMATQAAVAVVLFAVFDDRSIYLDVALWLTSFSFLGALVWARFLERGLL